VERALLMAFTNPVAGREAEYHRWYDHEHLPDVLKVDGVVSARRYEFVPIFPGPAPIGRFLAVYEVEGDLQAVVDRIRQNASSLHISDAKDDKSVTWMFAPLPAIDFEPSVSA
jgi:hypothetical protein